MYEHIGPTIWRIVSGGKKTYVETRESAAAYATAMAIVSGCPVTVTEVSIRSMTVDAILIALNNYPHAFVEGEEFIVNPPTE